MTIGGRGRLHHRRRGRGTLGWTASLAPLIDVLFLLVIFLLVSANFDRRRVLEVELPEASTARPSPTIADGQERVVVILADGSLLWHGQPTTLVALRVDLATRPPEDRLLPLFIQGDAEVSLELGIRVLDTLLQAGYANCAFEVKQSSPPK